MPHLKLRTTIIIGLPGETDEEFNSTTKLIREFNFDAVEINRYEDRPGTHVGNLADKISPSVIKHHVKNIQRYC